MTRIRIVAVLFALVVGCIASTFTAIPEADAAQGTKFFIVEWSLTWDAKSDAMQLRMKGRTKVSGGTGSDMEMTTTNVKPVLDILRTCATNRLAGSGVLEGSDDGGTLQVVKLNNLSCRAILK